MAAPLGIFSAKNIVVTINGVDIGRGLADGDNAVEIEDVVDDATILSGSDGSNVASISENRAVNITLRLLPGSAAHKTLLNKRQATRSGGEPVFSVGAREVRSNEGGFSQEAVIMSAPGMSGGAEAAVREWKIFANCFEEGGVA